MATSNDKSIESLDNQQKLKTLKRLRENVNWEIEEERRELLNQLYPLVKDWTDQLPNLRDIFRAEEMDWFIIESIKSVDFKNFRVYIVPFVNFLRRTGYKDEPKLDEDGTPLWRHTTPLSSYYTRRVIFELFKIYERYIGCNDYHFISVRRFLELGQDPHCLVRKTGRSTLHMALADDNRLLSSLLLTEGADPLLADEDGLTPLHIACTVLRTELIIKRLLEYPMVQVDALDKFGRTPLHYTVMVEYKVVQVHIQMLLENGANPNLADLDGLTPLHLICQRKYDVELIEPFFKICDKNHQLVQVDPQDNRGRTPLYYAVANLFPNNVDCLLNRGADLSKFVFPTESDFEEGMKVWLGRHYDYKLRIASGAMGVLDNLEERGYELEQNNVLMIMKWYAKYGLFEKSEELEKCLEDEEFMLLC
ncbi:uncharacterized protein LOC106656396 [Trichogramma pretiosum]|uniref:uncharacterized protein LOC106656396 n=1 Tax=Trichogramma pretiosum TaxID=7493 RepID=UPI000C71AF13|nr:uncharacterized protein LOC106656396 [Trichogramma pretiosum]